MPAAQPVIRSFPPIADPDATLLILGSMPGIASLAAGQYYAHPRNAFWPVLEAVWGIPQGLPYAERVVAVRRAGIAIWDVLQACTRRSSLDSDIVPASVVANDFRTFLAHHPRLSTIAFNGGTAAALFRRHVEPGLPMVDVNLHQMPSTSPANARLRLADKVRAWRALRPPT